MSDVECISLDPVPKEDEPAAGGEDKSQRTDRLRITLTLSRPPPLLNTASQDEPSPFYITLDCERSLARSIFALLRVVVPQPGSVVQNEEDPTGQPLMTHHGGPPVTSLLFESQPQALVMSHDGSQEGGARKVKQST